MTKDVNDSPRPADDQDDPVPSDPAPNTSGPSGSEASNTNGSNTNGSSSGSNGHINGDANGSDVNITSAIGKRSSSSSGSSASLASLGERAAPGGHNTNGDPAVTSPDEKTPDEDCHSEHANGSEQTLRRRGGKTKDERGALADTGGLSRSPSKRSPSRSRESGKEKALLEGARESTSSMARVATQQHDLKDSRDSKHSQPSKSSKTPAHNSKSSEDSAKVPTKSGTSVFRDRVLQNLTFKSRSKVDEALKDAEKIKNPLPEGFVELAKTAPNASLDYPFPGTGRVSTHNQVWDSPVKNQLLDFVVLRCIWEGVFRIVFPWLFPMVCLHCLIYYLSFPVWDTWPALYALTTAGVHPEEMAKMSENLSDSVARNMPYSAYSWRVLIPYIPPMPWWVPVMMGLVWFLDDFSYTPATDRWRDALRIIRKLRCMRPGIFCHSSQNKFVEAWKQRRDFRMYVEPHWLWIYKLFRGFGGDVTTAVPFLFYGAKEPVGEALYDFRMWIRNDELQNPDVPEECPEAVALDWKFPKKFDENTRLIMILHGLNGGSREPYIRDFTLKALNTDNVAVVVMVARGMGASPLCGSACFHDQPSLPASPLCGSACFHGGRTSDARLAAQAVQHIWGGLKNRSPRGQKVFLLGYSMGAIIASNLVANDAKFNNFFCGCVAISGNWDCSSNVGIWRSHRTWQPFVAASCKQHFGHFGKEMRARNVNIEHALGATDILQFDARLIAPYNKYGSGREGVLNYYADMSANPAKIKGRFLAVHALDDPMLPAHGQLPGMLGDLGLVEKESINEQTKKPHNINPGKYLKEGEGESYTTRVDWKNWSPQHEGAKSWVKNGAVADAKKEPKDSEDPRTVDEPSDLALTTAPVGPYGAITLMTETGGHLGWPGPDPTDGTNWQWVYDITMSFFNHCTEWKDEEEEGEKA